MAFVGETVPVSGREILLGCWPGLPVPCSCIVYG